ncbi:MAG: alpha/beta hydrolase [Alphaproteobacteria bacterium]|nr:alpha/beta hydrolase [Alphaproteobacteria bacterium]
MSDRTPLVLVPGLLCDEWLWRPQIEELGDLADITVADTLQDDGLDAMADRLLDAAPERFALAGLSMGGYVALAVMRKAPERVTRLALIDTSARPDTAEQKGRRRGLIELAQKGQFKGVTPRLLPLMLHPHNLEDSLMTNGVMAMAERVGKDAFLRQQKAILGRPDARCSLTSFHLPTLVLCGRQDMLTPLDAHEEMSNLIPGSRLVVIENCGHLSTVEEPDQVNAAMREWLTA